MYKNILVPVDVFEIGLADKRYPMLSFLRKALAGKFI
jgi:phenylalanine-4-hydroxylase